MTKPTKPRRRTTRTDRARGEFLRVLAETCNVSEAARAAGIGRQRAYEWRAADASFAKEWEEAEQTAVDKLEKVAWDRASEGLSDRMLELLLKAHRPERFKERVHNEHTGRGGGPIEYRNLDEDEIDARLRALAEKNAGPDRRLAH